MAKILFVMTGTAYWTLKDGTRHATGYWAEEFAAPFTNEEENAVGLAPRARWLLEDELIALGVDFTKGDMWKPYTVVDRNLFTGQNPASAAELAERLLEVL